MLKPSYLDSLTNYKKVILQRNNYLKERNIDSSVLDIWDIQLAKYGSKIISMRNDFIEKINEISARIHGNITDGKENLRIEYDPNIKIVNNLENELYNSIKKSQPSDIDDINVRSFGSQGQQRTAALSLKLAELDLIKAETGEEAILLLDDVMSELDAGRQEYLIKTLSDIQLFITTTEINDNLEKAASKGKIFIVENGKIKP